MWRTFALVLLLLNAVYWAWGEGWLLPYGFGPAQQREPQRLAQQIRPEAITVLRAAEGLLPPLAVVPEPTVCLQSGPLSPAQADALRALLEASWPPESWQLLAIQDGQASPAQASQAIEPSWRLRLPAADQALQARLAEFGDLLPDGTLDACPVNDSDR